MPAVSCPICNSDNPPRATVCQTCGASLGENPATGHSSALPIGTRLADGRYSVGKVLGQGGFGITYLGSDTSERRAVAIKELFPYGSLRRGLEVHPANAFEADDFRLAREKFFDEARILIRFNHPGIVDVYASFQENNTAYMVMEFLRGRSLGKLIEEAGPLAEREAVGYIRRAGEALEVVHQASLLHRDLKPDNIMLNDDGRVVLIDFGTARTFAAGRTGRMTTMVTPGYAPLEQYGQQVRFGPFTDIYALGATLYHLLTGQMPTPATDRASGIELKPPRRLNPALSRPVDEAVMWALEMRIDQRPQEVSEFLAALRPALSPARPAAAERPAAPPPPPAPDPWLSTPPQPRGSSGPPSDDQRGPDDLWFPSLTPSAPIDLEVEGDQIRWPDRCVCCFETPDQNLLLQHTGRGGLFGMFEETRGWEVPYCSPCLEHVQHEANHSSNGGGGLAAAAPLAGLVLGGPVGMLIGMGAGAAAQIFGQAKRQSELQSLMKPSCVTVGPAAAYHGWSGNRHAFSFLNEDYARAFQRENAASLVP